MSGGVIPGKKTIFRHSASEHLHGQPDPGSDPSDQLPESRHLESPMHLRGECLTPHICLACMLLCCRASRKMSERMRYDAEMEGSHEYLVADRTGNRDRACRPAPCAQQSLGRELCAAHRRIPHSAGRGQPVLNPRHFKRVYQTPEVWDSEGCARTPIDELPPP